MSILAKRVGALEQGKRMKEQSIPVVRTLPPVAATEEEWDAWRRTLPRDVVAPQSLQQCSETMRRILRGDFEGDD